MPPVDRSNPIRAASSQSKYAVMEFVDEFGDDAACLEWLWRTRYSEDGKHADCPTCERPRPFHKVKARPAWDCAYCGHHIHPLAGTIFHKSSTALHLWFYAMFLMSQTRCGISAKQLERELGVTYKTAWRMLNLIRNQLMDEEDDAPLSGDVEIDETYYGGKPTATETAKARRENKHAWKAPYTMKPKAPVLGMVERGGRIRATHIRGTTAATVRGAITKHVLPASMLFTDEWPVYHGLDKTYIGHKRIRHRDKIYVDGDVHTQTIEGFFGLVKNGIRGTYHAVSHKWLQGYLNEYVWRYNRRHDGQAMFKSLILSAAAWQRPAQAA